MAKIMICLRCGMLYLVHISSSGTDKLSCIYLMNEAISSELLHRARRLRSARDTTTSVAAPTSAAAVAFAAAAAAVDTDCLCIALLVSKSVQQLFCASYSQTTKFYVGDCSRCYSSKSCCAKRFGPRPKGVWGRYPSTLG